MGGHARSAKITVQGFGAAAQGCENGRHAWLLLLHHEWRRNADFGAAAGEFIKANSAVLRLAVKFN